MNALIRIVAAAVAVAWLIKLLSRQRPHVNGDEHTIRVTVIRSGNEPTIEVEPEEIHINFGDTVRWEHSENRLTIRPKPRPGRPWPFNNGQPQGDDGRPAQSGAMRPTAIRGVRHSYGIIVHTASGIVKKDPDIIIHM